MEEQINIRHFKLLNGEDILAVLAIKNDDNYIIERPVVLGYNVMGGVTFGHWFPLSSQKMFKLYKTRVMQHVPIDEDVAQAYIDFILNSPKRPTFKHQNTEEMIRSLVDQQMERITDEDYELPELEEKPKKILH